ERRREVGALVVHELPHRALEREPPRGLVQVGGRTGLVPGVGRGALGGGGHGPSSVDVATSRAPRRPRRAIPPPGWVRPRPLASRAGLRRATSCAAVGGEIGSRR